ncbi:M20 family metallopeptidase [Acuticoccus kandeliae]|uniref:M20 family metallopeptidase n=1 Tax=Acuticoccus kandeliae TaxID=2073160 RepID=UPI000D3E0B2C|nr:M20 family metallopeptidase [Acuticoccus kandeliae]
MVADLTALVALDTQNPGGEGEEKAARLIAADLSAAGYATTLVPIAPGRANVVATLVNGEGPTLAFNTHMDVVPVGGGWSSPPLALRQADGKLYGRGACDAKGQLVAMMEALRMLAADRSAWRGTVCGVFVADEEVGSAGARHFAATGAKVDYAVIGEPTSNAVVIAHKGSMRPIVRVAGVSAHSASPDLGSNAIYNAARLIPRFAALHHEIVQRAPHGMLGCGSLTLTRANGGTADNMVPDRMELMLDRRLVPGESDEAAIAEIEAVLTAARADGVDAVIDRFAPTTGGATETPPDHPIVAAARAASERHGVRAAAPGGFQGGCDLVHFNAMGATGVVIGPGDIAVAHKPDEFVPIDELATAPLIYRDLATAMLPVP